MNIYDVKYHRYALKYYRIETEHIDYINRFNDEFKFSAVLYTWEICKQRFSKLKELVSKLISNF